MIEDRLTEALPFDDVLLVPQRSDVLPSQGDVESEGAETVVEVTG